MDSPPFFVPCPFHSNKASHEICTSHLSPLKLSSCLECTYRFCNISQALKVLAVLVTDYPPCQEALLKFKQDTDQGPVSGDLQCVLLCFCGFHPVFDIYRASEDTTRSPSNRHFFFAFLLPQNKINFPEAYQINTLSVNSMRFFSLPASEASISETPWGFGL